MGQNVLDCDSAIAISHNYLVLPHACVILRTLVFICTQKYNYRFSYLEHLSWTSISPWLSLASDTVRVAACLLVLRFMIQ